MQAKKLTQRYRLGLRVAMSRLSEAVQDCHQAVAKKPLLPANAIHMPDMPQLRPSRISIGVSGPTDLPLSCSRVLIVRQTSFPRAVGVLYWLERDMISQWQSSHDL